MSWKVLTESDVLSKLSAPEFAALKSAALKSGQINPLVEVIAQIVGEVRGYVAANPKNTLGAAVGETTQAASLAELQGIVAIAVNAETKAIVFAEAFSLVPAVVPFVIPPAGGIGIQAWPSAITTAGFTANFGFPIPAEGYQLQWSAKITLPAQTRDAGATIPSELLGAAISRARFELATRLPSAGLLTEDRRTANTNALALLRDVARGTFVIAQPEVASDEKVTRKARPRWSARTPSYGRDAQDGL